MKRLIAFILSFVLCFSLVAIAQKQIRGDREKPRAEREEINRIIRESLRLLEYRQKLRAEINEITHKNKESQNEGEEETELGFYDAEEQNIPSANTNITGKVEMEIVNQTALLHSRILWGGVSKGPAIPLSDLKGNILAYEISFSIKHAAFPGYERIMQSVKRGRELVEEGYVWGDNESINRGRMLQWGVYDYRTIVISARYDIYPILEYSTGLSRFYTIGDLAKDKAGYTLGTTAVRLTKIYYAGPLDKWFEFTANDGRRILIDAFSLEAHLPDKILTEQPKQIQGKDFIIRNNRQAWEKVKSGIPIIKDVAAAGRIGGVPFYDWSYGCSPTSSAMILGFYDERGYDRLIDYYFRRWDPVEGEWDYNVPNVQQELARAMNTSSDGGTYTSDIAPGNKYVTNNINGYGFESTCSSKGDRTNNFHWNLIKKEINAGRPFHWGVNDYYSYECRDYIWHSVAAVGYTNDHYVIVHNTWDTKEHYWYYYTRGGDNPVSSSEVITIIAFRNRPPILDAIGNRLVKEGEKLQFSISGRDPDNDPIVFLAKNLPEGATFDVLTNIFSWTPSYTQSGTYTVRFIVSDYKHRTFEDVQITVINVKIIIIKP